jgi:hypothetical protein
MGQQQTNGTAAKIAYSIISSARASSFSEIARPSTFTVLRLIVRSNFVGNALLLMTRGP